MGPDLLQIRSFPLRFDRRRASVTRDEPAASLATAGFNDRVISRSLPPHASFRRKISRTRRIDTFSAGIGPPARHGSDEQSAEHRPAVERLPPLQGGRLQIGMTEIKIGISGRLQSGIGGRLPPEYAV